MRVETVQPLRLEAAVPTFYEGLWGTGHLCSTEDIADIHVRLSQEGDRAQKDAFRVVARQQGRLLGLMAVRNDVRSSVPITRQCTPRSRCLGIPFSLLREQRYRQPLFTFGRWDSERAKVSGSQLAG